MAKIEIEVGGVKYPARMTNGAALRFKHETGYDMSRGDGGIADSVTLLWCCLVSASKAEGKDFPYDLATFGDITPMELVQEWSKALESANAPADADGDSKKK